MRSQAMRPLAAQIRHSLFLRRVAGAGSSAGWVVYPCRKAVVSPTQQRSACGLFPHSPHCLKKNGTARGVLGSLPLFLMLDSNAAKACREHLGVRFRKSTQPGYSSGRHFHLSPGSTEGNSIIEVERFRQLEPMTPEVRIFDKIAFYNVIHTCARHISECGQVKGGLCRVAQVL